MGFTEIILLLQSVYWLDFNHDNFCQNLYFQPNALEQMELFHCDIESTSQIISQVRQGIY
jgi:hypothetical protein